MAPIIHLPLPVISRLRSSCLLSDAIQVVEELVCNSLDAGATQIEVDFSSCSVKVEDNGHGISRNDFTFVGERHATSKIRSLDELELGVRTLGFRGEALSCISDIALIEIISRTRESPHTYRKLLKNCKTLSLGLASHRQKPGTTVSVREIFANQPVRKKLLEKLPDNSYCRKLRELVVQLALSHPNVCFNVIDNEREEVVLKTSEESSLSTLIHDIFGKDIYDNMEEIDFAKDSFRLSGFISRSSHSFRKKDLQYFYINGRSITKSPVRKLLNTWHRKTVLEDKTCHDVTTLSKEKRQSFAHAEKLGFPAFVLNLSCSYEDYDITFESAKTYVEFKDWTRVLQFVQDVLQEVWVKVVVVRGKELLAVQDPETLGTYRKRKKWQQNPSLQPREKYKLSDRKTAGILGSDVEHASPPRISLHGTKRPSSCTLKKYDIEPFSGNSKSGIYTYEALAENTLGYCPAKRGSTLKDGLDISGSSFRGKSKISRSDSIANPMHFGNELKIPYMGRNDHQLHLEENPYNEKLLSIMPDPDNVSHTDVEQCNNYVRDIHDLANTAKGEDSLKAVAHRYSPKRSYKKLIRASSAPPFCKPRKKFGMHGMTISSIGDTPGLNKQKDFRDKRVRSACARENLLGTSSFEPRNHEIMPEKPILSISLANETEVDGALCLKYRHGEAPCSKSIATTVVDTTVVDMYQDWINPCLKVERGILDVSSGTLSTNSSTILPESISKDSFLDAEVLMQVDKKFIAAIAKGILILIDQHAADERIRLEELRENVLTDDKSRGSIWLDPFEEITLTPGERGILESYRSRVEFWGWRFMAARHRGRAESIDTCKVILTAVPFIEAVRVRTTDLVEYLLQLAETHGSSVPPPAVLRILNFKACRSAIMFGDSLLPGECRQLVEQLKRTALSFQCAHGRPTMVPIVNVNALRKCCSCFDMEKSQPTYHGLKKHLPTLERAQTRLAQAQEMM